MQNLKGWIFDRQFDEGIALKVEQDHKLLIYVLEDALFRIVFKKNDAFRLDRSWSIAPKNDVPLEGRPRSDMQGFLCPAFSIDETARQIIISTSVLRLIISYPLHLKWQSFIAGKWMDIAQDRPTGGYTLGRKDHAHAHYLAHFPEDKVFGLGEKSGQLLRNGRRFEMRNLDALGYDARRTDPLYKHIPFTVTRTANAGSYGLFYDNMANCWFDIAQEKDNYHQPYRSYRAEDGDLDYYFSWGSSISEVVKCHTWLTGGTAFMPRWSFGYSGSTMAYTDAPNAQEQLWGFIDLIRKHDIPCDSFHLSSGYSSINGKRYVFNWNYDKIPNPAAMAQSFADADLKLIANIKPCMLQDHPRYQEAALAQLFIKDSQSGRPERSSFWDDEGSNLDFTNPDTVQWWRDNVSAQLLGFGIEHTWNDHNEFEVWDREAKANGFGAPIDIALIRPVQAMLMNRASLEAQKAYAPDKRPYLITRSGGTGIQRYAQTWTGDNLTSWETLRYNIPMGLGLGLSGFHNIGHDVGGFAGPPPDKELFVRWVQNGIFSPRFSIHSWNDDDTANAPWMYPEVIDYIRSAIKLRYRLLPYIYGLHYKCVHQHLPMLRPIFYHHEADARCFEPTFDFMLGSDLLVANVLEPNAGTRRVYLPQNTMGWWDFEGKNYYTGGQEIVVPVDLASIPLFVRAGSIIPLGGEVPRAEQRYDKTRTWNIYPPQSGPIEADFFEDDGISVLGAPRLHTIVTGGADRDHINIAWQHSGQFKPLFKEITLTLPGHENRQLSVNGTKTQHNAAHSLFIP